MASATFPRQGAWATYKGKVGVINTITGETAEFHHADENGETAEIVKEVPLSSLAIATHEQIPERRRPTVEHARRLGYIKGEGEQATKRAKRSAKSRKPRR